MFYFKNPQKTGDKQFIPVRKLTMISSKNKASLIRLKVKRPEWPQLSLKNEIATGKMITFAIKRISIIKSQ